MVKKKLVIIGTATYSTVVKEAAELAGYSILGFVDPFNSKKKSKKKLLSLQNIKKLKKNFKIIIAIGDNKKRKFFFEYFKKNSFSFASVIHPSALVANTAKIEIGSFVSVGAIVNSNAKIFKNSIINSGSIVEHDTIIKEHSHIAPGVKIGGNSSVGKLSFIGIGSVILDCVNIGNETVVGGGSVVIKNLKSGAKFAGIPAKEIK